MLPVYNRPVAVLPGGGHRHAPQCLPVPGESPCFGVSSVPLHACPVSKDAPALKPRPAAAAARRLWAIPRQLLPSAKCNCCAALPVRLPSLLLALSLSLFSLSPSPPSPCPASLPAPPRRPRACLAGWCRPWPSTSAPRCCSRRCTTRQALAAGDAFRALLGSCGVSAMARTRMHTPPSTAALPHTCPAHCTNTAAGSAASVPPGLGEDPRPPPLRRHRHPQGPGAQGALASGVSQSVSFSTHTASSCPRVDLLHACAAGEECLAESGARSCSWLSIHQTAGQAPSRLSCLSSLPRAIHTLRTSLRPLRPAIAGRGRAGVSSAAHLSTQARNHPAQSPLWGQLTRLPVRTHKLKTFFPTHPLHSWF